VEGARDLFEPQNVHTCSVAHPATYLVGTGGGGALFRVSSCWGPEADHSPSGKYEWCYMPFPPYTLVCTGTTMYIHTSENVCLCVSTSMFLNSKWFLHIFVIPAGMSVFNSTLNLGEC